MPFEGFSTQLLDDTKTVAPVILLFLSPERKEAHREEDIMVSCFPLPVFLCLRLGQWVLNVQ